MSLASCQASTAIIRYFFEQHSAIVLAKLLGFVKTLPDQTKWLIDSGKSKEELDSWFKELPELFVDVDRHKLAEQSWVEADELKEVTFELTGSRQSGLAYEESDIDCAFVAPRMHVLQCLRTALIWAHRRGEMYKECKIESKTTKAGLPWCPIEGFLGSVSLWLGYSAKTIEIGPIKLDLTFRERKTHDLIQNHVAAKLIELFSTDEKKLAYITAMRMAVRTHDFDGYNKLKDWLRVLPPTQ